MSTSADKSGGPVAIRGYLVQTLVALLEIAQANPPFTEITLEPAHADDQFDFLWSNSTATFAVQVKSTVNVFRKSTVEKWAKKLQAVRTTEECQLILVGNYHTDLANVDKIDQVALLKKNLDLPGLFDQAAHQVAKFIDAQKLGADSPHEHELIAKGLVTELEHYSTTRQCFTRDEFIALLTGWVKKAPRHELKTDIDRIIKYAPAELKGRESELSILSNLWDKACHAETPRAHILTFFALGGEGKTSLVAKWTAELASQDWPGCEAVFAWSFYSQGTREQLAASSDLFLAAALTFFGDPAMANSPQGAFEKGRRLAQLVGQRRALLILDGLEPLQYPPYPPHYGALKDEGLAAFLKGLAGNSRGLCVVTTRYSIPDLKTFWQTTAPEHELKRLSLEAGVALLHSLGVKGSLRPRDGPKRVLADGTRRHLNEFETLVEDVIGHALTLQIMGGFLKRAFQGDIRKRDRVKFEKADEKIQGGHAFRTMAAYEKWLADESEESRRELAILKLMGLFDRPATADCVAALLKEPVIAGLTEPLVGLAEEDWEFSLTGLESAKLLTVHRDAAGTLVALDAHPLLREYFARQLSRIGFQPVSDPGTDRLEAYPTSATCREGHRRLYEHLCASTQEGDQPTLEDLQPLYQAVAHGCHAGLQQEAHDNVLFVRIRRKNEYYSTRKLGAHGSDLGVVACFFETLWSRLSPAVNEPDQAVLLNFVGYSLHALGRLTESLDPMRAGLEMRIKQEVWAEAARYAGNLSELELTLGEVAGAVGDAEHSVTYADRSGDANQQYSKRTTHANALHQAGRRSEAEALFCEAEQIQATSQPDYPLLYSLWGFRYCDLLLAAAERGAWLACLESRLQAVSDTPKAGFQRAACHAATQRATQTIKWMQEYSGASLLDIALDQLTLGRAALYKAILEKSEIRNAKSEIDQAVTGLRRAGQLDELPKALVTRAWQRFLSGDCIGPDSAQSDLEEAWEIAERGPMRLFMADILLHRARLFGMTNDEGLMTKYPWESPAEDLKEARRLIENCGYWRRKEELEDTERVILHKTEN